MKHLIASLLLATLALAVAQSQEALVGTWELEDECVFHFRDDGILIQNEYYEGDLSCVFVFPYTVDGDRVTIGEGLNWEFDYSIGQISFTRSDRTITVPSGPFQLPNGMTAVEEQSWGRIKKMYRR